MKESGRRIRQDARWSARVATASTFPPPGLFRADAATIAATMARPEVSPGGLGAAIRMVTFFINRAGRALPADRRRTLEAARELLRRLKAELPVTPPTARRPGLYRHATLGPVRVVRCERAWLMQRVGDGPPIPLGPDGWRHLRPAGSLLGP